MGGSITTHRTAINVSRKNQTFHAQITAPAGVTITVNDGHPIKVHKGDSVTFPVTIDAPSVANGQYQARINLMPRHHATKVTIPVAFVKKQGDVTLSNSCSPLSFASHTGVSHCTVSAANFSQQSADVTLNVAGPSGKKLEYKNVGFPGSVVGAGEGVQWSGTLSPAIPPQVTSVSLGSSPAGGYLPLSLFGGSRRSRALVTTRSRTSTCRSSSTAVSRTRASASCRTATSCSVAAAVPTSCSRRSTSRMRQGRTTRSRRCGAI